MEQREIGTERNRDRDRESKKDRTIDNKNILNKFYQLNEILLEQDLLISRQMSD